MKLIPFGDPLPTGGIHGRGGYYVGVGPAAAPGAVCQCGRKGELMECHTCERAFCNSCWWKHSHTQPKETTC